MTGDRLGGARRILAVRLDTIGDVVMTTPALKSIADSSADVTLLTSSVSSSLRSMLPYLKDLETLDVPWMKPSERHLVPHGSHLAVLDDLRARAFDGAIVFTVSTQDPACAAYLCYLCGIPRVATYTHGKLYGLLTDPVAEEDEWPPLRHEVLRQIGLVRSLGYDVTDERLQLEVPPPSRKVREVLTRVESGQWCVIHPGATAPSRRYPNDRWAKVIDTLQREGVRVVLAGGKQDRRRCTELAGLCKTEPLRVDARLTLTELTSLLSAAPAAATCNSSAAHLCAAAGTPVTTLYAGTNPQHTPWTDNASVLRRNTDCTWCLSSTCRHSKPMCIASITPAKVVESLSRQLDMSSGSPSRTARLEART